MKRSTLFGSALLASLVLANPAIADDSTSTTLWDQSPWNNEQVLMLFEKAYNEGRNYPTKEEFESIGLTFDLEFVRSHTRQRHVYKEAEKDVIQDNFNHNRKLWCNLPAGYGKGTAGYPSTTFDQDVFSLWNYTSIFGSWNYGFLQAPGCWVDAAHKNGTRIYSGIKFYESWNPTGEEGKFFNFIAEKNSDGSYKYARAFVNAAAYFGSDGYNYNSEGSVHNNEDWYQFHAAVQKTANDLNIENFGIGQYTQNANLSDANVQKLYGNSEMGKAFDCMLNYSGNKLAYRSVATSLKAAEDCGLGADDVYQGQLLVGLSNDYWTQMNTAERRPMNICIWGEHDQSRFFQFRVGKYPVDTQENYQLLLEKAFSGANRNPINAPAISNDWGSFQVASYEQAGEQLSKSPGFSSMIPERTVDHGNLPFETHFCLGNGESYFYNGKVTNAASWYNMSMQDIVPTYRWLVTEKGNIKKSANDIDVRFTYEDAYVGGSSLRLSGATSTGNDIVLYRTKIAANDSNVKATVALKGAAGASNLSVIVKTVGSDNWIETPCGNLEGTTWEVKNLNIAGISKGDVIEYIGFRVNSSAADYKLLVGKLNISDGTQVDPAFIKDKSLIVEVKEETASSLSVKLNWEPNTTGYSTSVDKFGMVYNDEINVDHFEILYKEGKDGRVKEVGRTSQWATYIGKLPMTQQTDAYIGVRSVSTDLKTYSPTQWVAIPHSDGVLAEAPEDPTSIYGASYCSSYGSVDADLKGCDAWRAIHEGIFWDYVKTEGAEQDINYETTENPSDSAVVRQYYYAKDHKLIVKQGSTITLKFKGHDDQGDGGFVGADNVLHDNHGQSLKWSFVNAYIDLDANNFLFDKDEVLFTLGEKNKGSDDIINGLAKQITIPADARTGSTVLRIVGSDAWTPHPGPMGNTVKGFSIDFPVEIIGNNAQREVSKTYRDLRDQGVADEPEYVENGNAAIGEIESDATFAGVEIVDGVAYFTNTDKAWFFNMDGRCVKFVNGQTSADVTDLATGVYVVKLQNGQVVRSVKVVKK